MQAPPSEPMLVLDPAMLSGASRPDDDDSDYEYEYLEDQTETFYLNLDLTSHQGPIRPARRRNDPTTTTNASTPAATSTATTTPAPSSVAPPSEENESTWASTESDLNPAERVQILGLHTANPLVSYQNQIFSCTWADQIGTELFFTRPDIELEHDSESTSGPPPLKRGGNFDLLAANSVKLLGRKANLISSAGSRPSQDVTPSTAPAIAVGPTARTGPPTNQMRFLEQLKHIKQTRGETDTVRTVFTVSKRSQNLEDRLRGWARTDEQLAEIERLNEAAIQGDADALAALEDIYSQIGSQEATR
ncbi:hypothetical protein FE257_006228 [Aspergillus nanangensis]|uniref:Transcription factor TFIIIC triple barrel domain-containing protein n=1 Tax=Aspergillus nanangensis TaxID=2582783 RepID=A0AAD4C9Z1_ASPNN|nr:hypothetical protein FE257_006228 [Aspergillus nanangensis]